MKKYFVIGNPINHSLSPKLHNYWLKENNIDATYDKKKVEEKNLQNIKEKKINGINVTVPFKKKVIPYLDKLSREAEQTQSVNTITFDGNNLIGHNTDIFGFTKAIENLDFSINDKNIFILGAGGVVPSIIFALKKMNVSEITISNRTKQKAEDLKVLFENLKTFKSEDLKAARKQAKESFTKEDIKLIGYDQHPEAIKACKLNAEAAGVEHLIEFKQQSLKDLKNVFNQEGVVVTNPPYGERLSEVEELQSLYSDLGKTLKNEFGGWDFWMLSGEGEALKALKFKASQKDTVWNGNIECRFLKYQIRRFKK